MLLYKRGKFSCAIFIFFNIYFTGIGAGFTLFADFSHITFYFDQRRSTATCLLLCGAHAGYIIVTPALANLFEFYGFTGTLMIHSALLLHIVLAGALCRTISVLSGPVVRQRKETKIEMDTKTMKSNTTNDTNHCDSIDDKGDKSLSNLRKLYERFGLHHFKSPLYITYILMTGSWIMEFYINVIFILGLAKETLGLSALTISWIISLEGAINIAMKFIYGPLFDTQFVRKRRLVVFIIIRFLTAINSVLINITAINAYCLALVYILGRVLMSASFAQTSVVLSEMVKKEDFLMAFGYFAVCRVYLSSLEFDWQVRQVYR